MRVLVVGGAGRLGSRVLAALLFHGFETIALVRTPSKIPSDILQNLTGIYVGDASITDDVKNALTEHTCDAVVNAAGAAAMSPWGKSTHPAIFDAVLAACIDVGKDRGKPLRAWLLGTLGMLDSPDSNHTISVSFTLFPEHHINLKKLLAVPRHELDWTYYCPAFLTQVNEPPTYPPPSTASAENLIAQDSVPPEWSSTLYSIPLVGRLLNPLVQLKSYETTFEDSADLIAQDLKKGTSSPWICKKVGVKNRP